MIRANDQLLQWTLTGRNQFQACGPTQLSLPAGAYSCRLDSCGNAVFNRRQLRVDALVDFAGSLPNRILEEIDRFWKLGDRFSQYGFLHRRGYLMYGKQGGGKSSLVHQIIDNIVSQGHVAFFCNQPYAFLQCMTKFREVEPNRPIVCIFEDIDSIFEHYGDGELLQWLDGNSQVDQAVNIATTNYPEKLDPRIISRPRRFDRILKIEAPNDGLRAAYFESKMDDLSREEIARWVELSAGLTFASLAELVISVRCLENDLEESVDLLRRLESHAPSSDEFYPQPEEDTFC